MGSVNPSKLLGLGSSRRAGDDYTDPVEVRIGVVTRADSSGVWVTPLDGDARSPLGPCRAATVPALVLDGTGYRLRRVLLPVRTEVLFTSTPRGVWVVSADLREG